MDIINHLGNIISEKIEISPAAGRGLIKLAIKDELGPFKSFNRLVLEDLKSVILNSLKKRFIQLKIKDPENLTKYMIEELIRNQSLIVIYRT